MGTLVNVGAILLGTALGAWVVGDIPAGIRRTVTQALALSVLLIGLRLSLQTPDVLVVIVTLVLGGAIGSALHLDRWTPRRPGHDASGPGSGPLLATLIFLTGPMAIVGSIADGLRGNPSILLAKSALDGTTALVLGATFGGSIALSAIPVLVYQGSITLGAHLMAPLLSAPLQAELSGVGGLMVMAIGLDLLEVTAIPVVNLLPALILAPAAVALRLALGWGP